MKSEIPVLHCGPQPVAAELRDNLTGGAPLQATTVRCWGDELCLHTEFRCVDAHPWATMTKRDAPIWTEEVVEVFIDPVGDGAGYFEIEVNPLGAVCDLVLRRIASGWRREFAWDCSGLQTSAERTSDGWLARLAIPWLSLVTQRPVPGAEWRINFHRIDRPSGSHGARELSSWSPTFAETFHDPTRFGRLRLRA